MKIKVRLLFFLFPRLALDHGCKRCGRLKCVRQCAASSKSPPETGLAPQVEVSEPPMSKPS